MNVFNFLYNNSHLLDVTYFCSSSESEVVIKEKKRHKLSTLFALTALQTKQVL